MRLATSLTAAIVVSIGVLATLPGAAGANTVSCANAKSGGTGAFSSSFGELNQLVLGSAQDGAALGIEDKGTDRHGVPLGTGFGCGNSPNGLFRAFTVYLGNKDDSVRADGNGITFDTGYGPVDRRVELMLRGGPGDDTLIGHTGGGTIRSGSGDDVIRDPGGNDVITGGSGDDKINAKDGKRDLIDCGGGNDRVKADPIDSVHGC